MIIYDIMRNKDLTSAERSIAKYLLELPEGIGAITSQTLADATATSKSTVTRFCQKLGCVSFREFQSRFDREQAELMRLRAIVKADPISGKTSFEEIMQFMPLEFERTASDVMASLDPEAVQRVVDRVVSANKVDVYGSGITESLAMLTAFKFSAFGIDCAAHTGLNQQYAITRSNCRDRVSIVFSMTGANVGMIHVANWLSAHGHYVVGIGCDLHDGLRNSCSDYLAVPTYGSVVGMEIPRSFNCMNTVIDTIYVALLVRDYENAQRVSNELMSSFGRG